MNTVDLKNMINDSNAVYEFLKEFETDKTKIIEYCKYAVKFFENV